MNELLFFIHVIVVVSFALGALRLGKGALIAWVAFQAILANAFVIKQMHFFGWEVTCSDVFAIGSILGLNLLQEYFGKESAKKATWTCFYFMIFFGVMSQIHLLYAPSASDTTQAAFEKILSPAPRLLIASLSVFFIVQQIDIRLYGFLKSRFGALSMPWRNGISLSVTQLLDTVLFSFLGLYGMVSSIFDIIVVSYLIKMLIIACVSPFTAFSRRVVKDEI